MMHDTAKQICPKSLSVLWLTLSIGLYSLFLSFGISDLTAFHHFGSFAVGAIFGICISFALCKWCAFRISTPFGILLTMMCLAFLIIGLAFPTHAYSTISLCATCFILLLALHAYAFLSAKSFETRLSLLLTFVGATFACVYFWCHCGAFSPDSYSYYEIAKTFPVDYGEVNTTRQYVIDTELGISFPYFYPLLLWMTDILLGYGIHTGVFLNLGSPS